MPGQPDKTLTSARASWTPVPRRIVGVASGKGGVGKSTVAVNLAVALAATGVRCGLLDADLYGPSVPLMLGLRDGRLRTGADGRIRPLEAHGVRVVSAGFMIAEGEALIWRGAILHKLIRDLVHDVDWDGCDYLIVDLPPGTGDVPLALRDAVALSGMLLVTTPQQVALADAARAHALCRELGLPVLGLVENMGALVCPHCHGHVDLFPPDGGRDLSARLGIPLLGRIPFDPATALSGDLGLPVVIAQPQSAAASAFHALARTVLAHGAAPADVAAGLDSQPREQQS